MPPSSSARICSLPVIVNASDVVVVRTTVTNTSDVDGDEVVQLYVRDPSASLTRPVLELKSFARVAVPARSSVPVTFRVPIAQLGFVDRNLDYVIEPGTYELHVGNSSTNLRQLATLELRGDQTPIIVEKSFGLPAQIGQASSRHAS